MIQKLLVREFQVSVSSKKYLSNLQKGASNQQSAKVLRLVVQKVRQLIKVDDHKTPR